MNKLAHWISAIIAVLALGAILWRVDVDAVTTAMAQGHVLAMIPWVAALSIGYISLLVAWDRLLLSRTPLPPRYFDVWVGKVGTAVLNAIGHALGSGGFAVWIARATGVGVASASAIVIVGMLADLAALILVALAAMLIGNAIVPGPLVTGAAIVLGAIAMVVLAMQAPFVQARLHAFARLRNFAATASAVGPGMWVKQILGRTLNIAVLIAGMAMAATAFGLQIPVAALCALLPVALLVQVLPVNVAGFGAAQVAFVVLFSEYESEAQLLAFHLLWQLTVNVCVVIRGLPFMKRATQDITRPQGVAEPIRVSVADHRD